ncbi:MAG TPA: hypothetical protein VG937_10435 [Polyangiaceae bacterium]|nr:hypothetical protein [Polyangiaceae bacterium]
MGCSCTSSTACEGNAECLTGVCRPSGALIAVEGEGVRGCDVVVGLPELAGAKAEFDAALIGEGMQRGKRFALSFTAREDSDLAGEIAVVRREPTWFGDATVGWSKGLTLESALCYDRAGVFLESAGASVR